jgi:hypothetical protein
MTMTANSQAPIQRAKRAALLNYFSLFSSFSTLICCALPSVLVLLGMGTTVASLLSAAPWLVSLSRHKIWTFSIAGVLIAMSFVMTYLVAPRQNPGNRHFDRSCSRPCEQRSGEIPLLLLGSFTKPLILLSLLALLFFFCVFSPKTACQVPKPLNPLPVNDIHLAF